MHTPDEIAALYVRQFARWHDRGERSPEQEPSALTIWEDWITREPELAWQVILGIVALRRDDEMLQQVGYRIRMLLWRFYDDFVERAKELVERTPRFARIVGDGFFERERYTEKPLDVEALIRAERTLHDAHAGRNALDQVIKNDPLRALPLVVEIIHRGPARGFGSDDTFDPLRNLLRLHGPAVIDDVERIAATSYRVRRAIWRMEPGERGGGYLAPEIWARLKAANAGTSDFTDDVTPEPQPRTFADDEERWLEAWFTYEENFWAFDEMRHLLENDPETAWSVLLQMLDRTDDEYHIGALAAGPLEDLLYSYGEQFLGRVAAEAKTNAKLREALRGVWLWSSPTFPQFRDAMRELGIEVADPKS
jgi:hypothetical protein